MDETEDTHDRTPRRPWWRRKRWAALFAAWLAAVYPLGYGPAFGYAWRTGDPRAGEAVSAVYGTMDSLRYDGPAPVRAAVGWYRDLWMPEGWNRPRGCFGLPTEYPSDNPGEGGSAGDPE